MGCQQVTGASQQSKSMVAMSGCSAALPCSAWPAPVQTAIHTSPLCSPVACHHPSAQGTRQSTASTTSSAGWQGRHLSHELPGSSSNLLQVPYPCTAARSAPAQGTPQQQPVTATCSSTHASALLQVDREPISQLSHLLRLLRRRPLSCVPGSVRQCGCAPHASRPGTHLRDEDFFVTATGNEAVVVPLLQANKEPTCVMRNFPSQPQARKSFLWPPLQAGQEPTCLMDFWAQRCLAEVSEAAEAGVPPPVHTGNRAMADTVMDFLFASQDASTASLVWVTCLMAEHPEVLAKVTLAGRQATDRPASLLDLQSGT